jgi:biopolymer transport protein ExbB
MELVKAYLDISIFGLLGLMTFLVTWFFIERMLFFRSVDIAQYKHSELLHVDLTKHLTVISSIGANAPYVGLLGTVIGILIVFYDMGMTDKIETGEIMVGLALALKVTAAGIALAIPSIMIYNGLMRKVDVIEAQFQAYKAEKSS